MYNRFGRGDSLASYDNVVFENCNLRLTAVPFRTSAIDSLDDFSKVFHEDVEIKCFVEGTSTLCIGTENITVGAGDVVFINPYEFHSTVENGEVKGKYHLLMIGLDFFGRDNTLMDLRNLFISQRTRIVTIIRNNERISSLVAQAVLECAQHKEYYENIIKGIILELFSLLLRDYKDGSLLNYPDDKEVRRYRTIYPAIQMIRRDCTKEHSIDELSLACNVSKYHFCRIFKESTGMSAVEYRNEYRLQTANSMLKSTDITVAEVSLRCGFDDPAYFSRCYKNKYGISPLKDRAISSK